MDQTVIIAINSGVGLRMIGNTGQYVKEFTDAMKFADEIEAYEYIERHGLEKDIICEESCKTQFMSIHYNTVINQWNIQ